ncbi:MAG: MFS transporter [Clostridiales bacterium]|nr:MFS transporter [Clostridiales bacterium]
MQDKDSERGLDIDSNSNAAGASEGGNPNPLWTKDFTIITIGSVISIAGSVLSGFAMSLFVLDYTGKPFYFALFGILYFLPSVAAPILAGPFLDRFSRKKTIYMLDFITSGIYVIFTLVMQFGRINMPIVAAGTFLIGTINSVYQVAYQSFYPLLITKGNYSKAYSIASSLETLAMMVTPISAFVYNKVGLVPLLAFNAVTYFIAAVMETQITQSEDYIEKRKAEDSLEGETLRGLKRFASDFKEGMSYLVSEKGLFFVAIYFTFSAMDSGVIETLTLPYFKMNFENGEYIYMVVGAGAAVGRVVGGMVHYRLRLPQHRKFDIALFVYISLGIIGAIFLYTPLPAMFVLFSLTGILGVTSYNIRISATQRYVPDEKKGRFNGTFNTLNVIGMLIGQAGAGIISLVLDSRTIITISALVGLAAAVVLIGGNRRHIAPIYNTED